MSIADFGNSVEEVRKKLSEILPLVDAGQQEVEELHSQFAGELSTDEENYETLAENWKSLGELAETSEADVDSHTSEITGIIDALEQGVEEFGSIVDELSSDLDAAKEQVESVLAAGEQAVLAVAETLSAEFTNLLSGVGRVQETIDQLREGVNQQLDALTQGVAEFATRFQADLESAEDLFNTFTDTASDLASGFTETLTSLGDAASDAASNFVDTLGEHHGEIGEFFSIFATDSQNLFEEFSSQVTDLFGQWKSFAEEEVGGALREAVEHAMQAGVEALATEILASVATTQMGVATTGALSPVLPEIVAAQKLTELINSIL